MRRLHELYSGPRKGWAGPGESGWCFGTQDAGPEGDWFVIPGYRDHSGLCCGSEGLCCGPEGSQQTGASTEQRLRVNILAMGDVGGTLALAMRITGADIVSRIGICDISETVVARWEQELNQIALPSDPAAFPQVQPVPAEDLFDCDVFVFCASLGVPDLSQKDVDVRMVQLEKNRKLIREYASRAVQEGFGGEFFVVSDPVDPLCREAVSSGIPAERVQGFGLGVMNGRAVYYARQTQTAAMAKYLTEGRVYGPHGEDLVVANSIIDYDEEASLELTRLTVEANLRIRELGFKPYIAPAVTSGALSILENLRGHWQYSSAWFGAAFLGMRNRRCSDGLLIEDPLLDERLFARIERAYENLKAL